MKKSMDSQDKKFEVEFTEQCIEEMNEIYLYISNILNDSIAAKKLISKVNERILALSDSPELYVKIEKTDRLNREYHKIVIQNYIVLYTIDYENKLIYVSRMVYRGKNYL